MKSRSHPHWATVLLVVLLLLLSLNFVQAFLPPSRPLYYSSTTTSSSTTTVSSSPSITRLYAALDENAVGEGCLLEIEREKNKPNVLALVLSREKSRLTLVDAQGREWEGLAKEVRFRINRGGYTLADLKRFSTAHHEEDEALAELAWEALMEDKEGNRVWTPSELADLMFNHGDAVHTYRAYRVLESSQGKMFFKSAGKGGEGYKPLPATQVEVRRQQYAKEEARKKAFEEAAKALATDPSTINWEAFPPRFQGIIDKMKEVGMRADAMEVSNPSPHEPLVFEFLEQLGLNPNRQGAFQLLVTLGIWHPHENLDMLRQNVSTVFPPSVEEEALSILASLPDPDAERRRDLRYLRFMTIDDETTKEVDDAVAWDEEQGVLWVAIADPSRLVGPTEAPALFKEAFKRQSSIYLPTGTIPMFPLSLAAGPMSLLAGEDCPGLCLGLTIDPDTGAVTDIQVDNGLIHIYSRLDFNQVDLLLNDSPDSTSTSTSSGTIDPQIVSHLKVMSDLARSRRKYRMDRGCTESFGIGEAGMPEPDIRVTLHDDPSLPPDMFMGPVRNMGIAASMIMEVMVAANEAMGRFAAQHNIPVMYRSQQPPSSRDGSNVRTLLEALPEGWCRAFAIRRFFSASSHGTKPSAHAGLGLEAYVQCTSPIRRFSDFVVHHNVKAYLRDPDQPHYPFEEKYLTQDMARALNRQSASSRISRMSTRYWLVQYLRTTSIGRVFQGVVLGAADRMRPSGFAVFLPEIGMEIQVRGDLEEDIGNVVGVEFVSAGPRSEEETWRLALDESWEVEQVE